MLETFKQEINILKLFFNHRSTAIYNTNIG